jgi:co-chaperonin GroES (HSP10)
MQSKYLSFFTNLCEVQPNFYKLYGSRILVEVLPEPELKTEGGLFVGKAGNFRTDTEENKFTAAVVIATGNGYFDDESGEDVPLDVKPGQVVEVVRSGLRRYSSHPILGAQYTTGDLALINESHVSTLLAESVEDYAKALTVISDLRSAIK